jgi:hypothetical protein
MDQRACVLSKRDSLRVIADLKTKKYFKEKRATSMVYDGSAKPLFGGSIPPPPPDTIISQSGKIQDVSFPNSSLPMTF